MRVKTHRLYTGAEVKALIKEAREAQSHIGVGFDVCGEASRVERLTNLASDLADALQDFSMRERECKMALIEARRKWR